MLYSAGAIALSFGRFRATGKRGTFLGNPKLPEPSPTYTVIKGDLKALIKPLEGPYKAFERGFLGPKKPFLGAKIEKNGFFGHFLNCFPSVGGPSKGK